MQKPSTLKKTYWLYNQCTHTLRSCTVIEIKNGYILLLDTKSNDVRRFSIESLKNNYFSYKLLTEKQMIDLTS